MAVYRIIHLKFWEDAKVSDDFTPEDKYFYLYLLTNPHTNLCGCYEISMKQISREIGYNEDIIKHLIDRMQNVHDVIKYDKNTKEILIWNWYKYNWSKSEKVIIGVKAVAAHIKSDELRKCIFDIADCVKNGTEYKREYPMHTSVSVSDSVSATDSVLEASAITSEYLDKEVIERIVKYLNDKCDTNYRSNTVKTKSLIRARLKENFTEKDFYEVIDKKSDEWKGTEQEKFLRPETLFGTKFEGYLNQKSIHNKRIGNKFNHFPQREYDFDELEKQLLSN